MSAGTGKAKLVKRVLSSPAGKDTSRASGGPRTWRPGRTPGKHPKREGEIRGKGGQLIHASNPVKSAGLGVGTIHFKPRLFTNQLELQASCFTSLDLSFSICLWNSCVRWSLWIPKVLTMYGTEHSLCRENILVLDIFFEALNYETIEQKKAYEVAALLGKSKYLLHEFPHRIGVGGSGDGQVGGRQKGRYRSLPMSLAFIVTNCSLFPCTPTIPEWKELSVVQVSGPIHAASVSPSTQ